MLTRLWQGIFRAGTIALVLAVAAVGMGEAPAPPTTADPKAWEGLTPEQIAAVKQGEMVILQEDQSNTGEQKRFIRCAMVFDQPIEKAWALIGQTERQDEYLPGLDNCELVKREGNWDQVDFHVKIFFVKIDYRVKHERDPERYYQWWNLDPSYDNDLAHLEGYWQFYAMDDGRTLGRYGTKLVVARFIPDSIQEYLTKNDLPKNLDAVRKWINSAGAWHK